MLKKIAIACFLFLFSGFYSFAQIPSPLIFSKVTKKEGLASNTIFRVEQDKQGFLWIATQNGLQRYDGNRFLTFRHIPGSASSIPDNIVNRVFIDSKERLWLLFDRHAGIFSTTHFNYSETKIDPAVNQVKKIMEDRDGKIILFADNKILLYNESENTFNANYPLPALPPGYSIADMSADPSNGLYWFTGKQGSLLYDPKTKQFYPKEQNTIHDPMLDQLGAVKNVRYPYISKDGMYWMVNWIPFTAEAPIVYRYDKKKNKLQRFEKIRPFKADSYYEVWNFFQQSNGTVWIYGMGLLAYYNPAEDRFVNIKSDRFQQNGIEYDFVSHLSEDKEKNVWVSTNNGLYRFNVDAQVLRNIPNRRPNDTTAIYNAVSAIVQTKNNGIWVSTWGAGVFSYSNDWHSMPNPVTAADPDNKLLHAGCMIQRSNGEVWIGTQTGELKIYDPALAKCYSVLPSVLQNEIITQLLEDKNRNIWIGTSSGLLIKWENGDWKDTGHALKTVMPPSAGDIMKLYQDNKGHLWIGTSTQGLYEMNEDGRILNQFRQSTDKNPGLLNDGVTDILQYNDSIYLLASGGLCILNNKTNAFRYLTTADGLPAEHITSLIPDKRGRLWVAVDGGLYRLNIDSKLYISYDAADGMINDNFQVSSAVMLQDGRIVIGTAHDFLVFDPEKIADRKELPLVNITGFSLNSKNLSVDSIQQAGNLSLAYDNTFIRIQLSTLSFRDAYYIYYMLEGLDKEWKRVYNNEITYQYLPPHDYILKLKSMNGEGTESKITELKIQVDPPFWQTWWFYCVVLLLIGALLFWIDQRRIKRKTAMLKMRSDIADNLHRDINAALDNITILSKMAKIKADTEPEKSKEFIEEIHTKSENMTLAMDDMLWSIDPGNDSMEKLMPRFREHINALESQYNVRVDVLIDKKAENLPLQMKFRNDILWLFKGGIKNVVRTGAQNCRVHITYEKSNLLYTLEFDTGSMDMKQLNNLRQRGELSKKLEELGAKLDFEVHKTNAVFLLSIPVK